MKNKIINAFDQADQYANHAVLQRQVVHTLAGRLPALSQPRILELGCGTGLLSQQLLARWPQSPLVCSDISHAMVRRCRTTLGERANLLYAVMDGEQPAVRPGFDLIATSMVLQWFTEPLRSLSALHALLAPGGLLAFATLGAETFREWQTACTALGLAHGLAPRPAAAAWQQAWPTAGAARIWEERITLHHPSGLAFLQNLRALGAHLPTPGYHPLTAGQLRRLLRSLEHAETGQGFAITYHVLYGLFGKT
ncbi:MAG: methyltransferase [Magnetococcus sp. MYC-9]